MSEDAAGELPVARVAVDVSLAHLDRPFDYLVPPELTELARPGCRVKVGFSGKEVGGYVLGRTASSEHPGRLARLRRVISPEPVLTPEVARVTRAVADRYAGSHADVLRLAVPPRHARTEREAPGQASAGLSDTASPAPAAGPWAAYGGGEAFLARVGAGSGPRAVWTALPGEDWPLALATAAATALATGHGSITCLPDRRDVERVSAAAKRLVGADRVVTLTAELGPAARYRAFLTILRGHARLVVGTRAAAFAPVRDLRLVAIWDDGDDLYAEPRAPYPHAREVLALRAVAAGCAALFGGFAHTAEAQLLLADGWARPVAADRHLSRRRVPLTQVAGDSDRELARDPLARSARLPRLAFDIANAALAEGPVLVQVPRGGYVPALACRACHEPARCGSCTGPLALAGPDRAPGCRWCGRPVVDWRCAGCGGRQLRAPVVGSGRTAEELGRAFPGTPVRRSGGEHVLDRVDATPALVVATPGAEPLADGGYAAALILDTRLALARPDLRTGEETLRRWLNAAALVRPGTDHGRLVLVGDPAAPPVQALLRWDPAGFARRELAERASARLPPAAFLAVVSGDADAVRQFGAGLMISPPTEVLGPVPGATAGPGEEVVRAVIRAPREQAADLRRALKDAQARRSARKLPPVRVQVDPQQLG